MLKILTKRQKQNKTKRPVQNRPDDPEFCEKLLASDLFVLTDDTSTTQGPHVLEEETSVNLIGGQTEDGVAFIPVFTSLQELESYVEKETCYMSMAGWNLFPLLQGSNVALNPASAHGVVFSSDDIENILGHFGVKTVDVEEGTPLLIGQPETDPVYLKQTLSDIFRRDGRVQSAHLCSVVNQNNGEQSLVVGVVFKPGQDCPDIFNIAGPAASQFLPEGHTLDFMIISDNDGLSGILLQDGDCFFSPSP